MWSRRIRIAITTILTLAAIALGAALLWTGEEEKRKLDREYVVQDCNALQTELTKQAVIEDYYWKFFDERQGKQGLLHCYCTDLLKIDTAALIDEQFINPETGQPEALCRTWLQVYALRQFLTFGGAVFVALITVILRTFLKLLVKFERPATLSSELQSRALKFAVVQLLNVGFVVLLLNARVSDCDVLGCEVHRDTLWYRFGRVPRRMCFAASWTTFR